MSLAACEYDMSNTPRFVGGRCSVGTSTRTAVKGRGSAMYSMYVPAAFDGQACQWRALGGMQQ